MKQTTVFIVILIAFLGCAQRVSVYEKDEKLYGVCKGLFSSRWWNYFERGVSYAEGEFYEDAIADFKQAIRKRGQDKWRARTYGMHFSNYFPHRELGAIYYRLKRYDEAIQELEYSLQTAESAKAKYFLNLARKKLLESSGKDKLSPTLTLKHPPAYFIVNTFNISVSGIAEDDTYVSQVKVNNTPIPLELSTPQYTFEMIVNLNEGSNSINVYAEDITGKHVKKELHIISDRRGPLIGISDFSIIGGKGILNFFVVDDTGIDKITVNNKDVSFSDSATEVELTEEVRQGQITISARDVAGNLTHADISSDCLSSAPAHLPFLASLDIGKFLDADPPAISLQNIAETQEVYLDNYVIEGKVTDASPLQSLTINGEEILHKKGGQIFFSTLKKLRVGENIFSIKARDSFGNSTEQKIVIKRKIKKVNQIGSRMSIAILPLQSIGTPSVVTEAVYDKLISAFVKQQRFQIVERQKLDSLLLELKMSDTDLVNPAKATKMGRIIAADTMLTGTILETEKSIEIITHLVDTETSAIMASNDVYDEDKSLKKIENIMAILAFKFKRDFPLLEGIIIDTMTDSILVSIGQEKNIRNHSKLICFREGEEIMHPVTGRVLGVDSQELGVVKIKDVFDYYSNAEILSQDQKFVIQDKVITK